MTEKTRVEWIDNIKGLLLLLTCCSHFIPKPWVVHAILIPTPTYYVPLFFFISGYLCSLSNAKYEGMSVWGRQKTLIIRRWQKLMTPYFFFSFVGLLHGLVVGRDCYEMLWNALFIGTSCYVATPMYFVSLLFMTSVFFTWVTWSHQFSNLIWILLEIIGLSLFWIGIKDLHITLPWHLKSLPFTGALFLSGFLSSMIEYDKNSMRFLLPLLFVLGLVGMFFDIKGTLLAIICPVSLGIGLVGLIKTSKRVEINLNRPVGFLQFVSINGVVILGAHNIIYGYCHMIAKHYWQEINEWFFFPIVFVIVFSSLYYLVVPFMNKYLFFMTGFRKIE